MIHVFSVDDDNGFLDALASFFGFSKELTLAGQYGNVEDDDGVADLIDTIEEVRPDIVLMDFDFQKANRPSDFGITLIKQILKRIPQQRIIVMTGDSPSVNPEVLTKVGRSFQAGAIAYLRKDEPHTWTECIKETAGGRFPPQAVPESVVKIWIERLKQGASYRLTDREIEAVRLLAESKRVKEIAEAMNITFDGANFHLDNAKIKLGVDTLHGLTAKALRLGVIV